MNDVNYPSPPQKNPSLLTSRERTWWINPGIIPTVSWKVFHYIFMLRTSSLTWSDSCSYLYSVPTLSPNHSQLAPLLNNHSFHLQFPATHAPPCFAEPSHPSQKHPHKRTTLLFVCLKTRGTLSHFLFTSGHLHEGPLPHLVTPNGSANTERVWGECSR